jgi:phosphoribosylglycinamide formyltransferase 1
VAIDTASWRVPPIFEVLRRIGNIPEDDYRRTFNLGVGMIFAVPARAAARAEAVLSKLGESPFRIGEVIARKRGRPRWSTGEAARHSDLRARLEFRGDCGQRGGRTIDAEIAVVISNRPGARGLEIARERGLNAVCLPSKGLDREVYDRMVLAELAKNRSTGLSGGLHAAAERDVHPAVSESILNIHPSLLPAFPGLDAQHQALEHGVRITGCTVHFVDEELDAGPIILQAAVPVLDDDTWTYCRRGFSRRSIGFIRRRSGLCWRGQYRIVGRRVALEAASP